MSVWLWDAWVTEGLGLVSLFLLFSMLPSLCNQMAKMSTEKV